MKLSALFACSLLAASISACADDGDFSGRASQVEGIYRVTSHTLNDQACSPGGSTVQDMHGFAFAKRNQVFGRDMLMVYSCASLQDCQQKAAAKQFEGTISFAYTVSEIAGDALTGNETTSGYGDGKTCSMPEVSVVELTLDADLLTIAKKTKVGHDYPAQGGACTTDMGRAATQGVECSEQETLKATMVQAL